MWTRREYLKVTLAAGAAMALPPCWARAEAGKTLITRPIPSTGERLPVVGLGGSATFSKAAGAEEHDALREVIRTLVEQGGTVIDTAPAGGFGRSARSWARAPSRAQ